MKIHTRINTIALMIKLAVSPSVWAASILPGAPTQVSAVAGNAQATVSFKYTAASGSDGSGATSFIVTSNQGQSAKGAQSPITVTGLANGTSYTFTIQAVNAAGKGPASNPSPAVVPAGPPSAPSISSTVPGDGRMTINWKKPADNGAPITSYVITSNLNGSITVPASDMTKNSAVFMGLANGVSAAFTVKAVNKMGTSVASALSDILVPNPQFFIEPRTGTLIGVGQEINIYGWFKSNLSDLYPNFVDASALQLSSSAPAVASIAADGTVTAKAEGSTIIKAKYGSYSAQVAIQVSGQLVKRTVRVAGQSARTYLLYTPNLSGTSNSPLPLLLSLHGGGGNSMLQASMSLLPALATGKKFLVAFGDGTGQIQTWNGGACCGSAQTNNVDDVAYINAVLDDIIANARVNASKIFSTGFSNGGIMSHRLACQLADRISGIAAVSGGSGQFDLDHNQFYTCNPTRPIPILHIHAMNDRNYPYDGGFGKGLSNTNFNSIPNTIADWVKQNNVKNIPRSEIVSVTTVCQHYDVKADPRKPSAPVVLCAESPTDIYDPVNDRIFNGGHSWPGGMHSTTDGSDIPLQDFNADAYLWNYLMSTGSF